jgi:beta-hydroxylase
LITPNSDQCYIVVDGERYFWRDGEAVMFDETYIHYAENTTTQQRVILFCDVERPLTSRIMTAINRWFARNVMKASATQNVEGEKIGALNRLFGGFYQFRLRAKQLKGRSRATYYVLKWLLFGGLFYLLFV